MADLTGKTALVTGGSRGIGRAVVERLAADGATVRFGYVADRAAADDVVATVTTAGGSVSARRADMADVAAVRTLVREAADDLGGLDVVVNNAATGPSSPTIADTPDEEYDRLMAVNARGVFVVIREAVPLLRDGGSIVNLSTVNTVLPSPGVAVYAASKAAVEQFTAVAARELGPRGITVNTVSPGATDTDGLRGGNTEQGLQKLAAMSPLGRLGRAADVADVVAFLVGPDGRWMTGQNLRASGGLP